MKRFLFVIITIFAINSSTLKAQEVYNLVLNNATRIVNNPTCSYTQIQIAQFKRTALIYMKTKAFEETDSVPSNFSEFITLFFNDVVTSKRLSDEKRKKRIMMFTDASISNPMFEDTDQETTLAFIKDGGELTPFSIDTDWQKAYTAAIAQLKKK